MRDIGSVNTLVIKIGSSSLFNNGNIDKDKIDGLLSCIKELKEKNIKVIIVSSGAVALGRNELSIKNTKDLATKQACASIGQGRLMDLYSTIGNKYNLYFGQVLVNHDDFEKRTRVKHLKNTLNRMLELGIIPVINENDTLAVEEIKVGDNDTLSALISALIKANLLVLFSDIDGLFNKDPRKDQNAKLIDIVNDLNDVISFALESSTEYGTGGMITKLDAARIANEALCKMIICNSNKMHMLDSIINGEKIGTLFLPSTNVASYSHWLIFNTKSKGEIIVDKGLYEKLINTRVSILPKGIIGVNGDFNRNDIVSVVYENKIIGKGITNYSSEIINYAKGHNSSFLLLINDNGKKEIIHADNLVRMVE